MIYRILKLHFTGNVHFGEGMLESTASTFCADTLFSALCHDAPDEIPQLVCTVREGRLAFSDAFPYDENGLYLPKPCQLIRSEAEEEGSSVRKKQFKALGAVPTDLFPAYLAGGMTDAQCADAVHALAHLGRSSLQSHVAIPREAGEDRDDPSPYRVGVFHYREGCGAWIVAAGADSAVLDDLTRRIRSVGLSGIGGRRSSGCGRFTLETEAPSASLAQALAHSETAAEKMALSVCLPKPDEMAAALADASYLLMRRSGFVASDTDPAVKKRDLFVFQAGSCFRNGFAGDVYEVSSDGSHPVYRYAAALFLALR